MTVTQAATVLRCSPRRVRFWIERDLIQVRRGDYAKSRMHIAADDLIAASTRLGLTQEEIDAIPRRIDELLLAEENEGNDRVSLRRVIGNGKIARA